MRIITTFLVILGLVGTASAQVNYDPRAPLYIDQPTRVGTFGECCAAAPGRTPPPGQILAGTSWDPCVFGDVDSCVEFARGLRRSNPAGTAVTSFDRHGASYLGTPEKISFEWVRASG
jgi:hypothetical protein